MLDEQGSISKLPFQEAPAVQEGRGRAEVVALAAAVYEHRSPQSSLCAGNGWPVKSALRPAVLGWVLHKC